MSTSRYEKSLEPNALRTTTTGDFRPMTRVATSEVYPRSTMVAALQSRIKKTDTVPTEPKQPRVQGAYMDVPSPVPRPPAKFALRNWH